MLLIYQKSFELVIYLLNIVRLSWIISRFKLSENTKNIIVPQALRNSIPNLTTQIIELIKDTSLAFTIGIIDMMGQVQLIIGNNYGLGMLEVYIVISIIYWMLALIVQGVFTLINKVSEKPYQA